MLHFNFFFDTMQNLAIYLNVAPAFCRFAKTAAVWMSITELSIII